MAVYAGGLAGGGGTAPPAVFPMLAATAQYAGAPVDHAVIPQPPPPTWTGEMTVTDAPSGGLTVADTKRG